jgi:hypothetical protein
VDLPVMVEAPQLSVDFSPTKLAEPSVKAACSSVPMG